MAARNLVTTLVSSVAAAFVSVTLGLLVWRPLVLLALVPILVYSAPEIKLGDMIAQRREGVDRELPFFAILVNVLGSAGVSLYSVLSGLGDSGVFPFLKTEAASVRREVEVFGTGPNEALEKLAADHPSRRFGSFVFGYTSKVRSGGDMPAYLTGESGYLMRELEEGWTRYVGRAGMVGSLMITVFGLIPLLLLVVGVFSPSTSLNGLVVFTAIGVPFFTVLLIYLAARIQPVGDSNLSGNFLASMAISAPVAAAGYFTHQLWLAVAAGLAVFFLAYGVSVREQIRERREIDEALPEFIKDVLEFRRQDYDLTRSLVSIATNNRYNGSFDQIMARVSIQLKGGTPIDEVQLDPKTRLARLVFMVLGQMGRSGGGSVDTVYQLSAYTTKVVEMKRNTLSEMKPYMVLSYVSPVLLAFGVTFVGGMLRSFGNTATAGVSALKLSGLQLGGISPAMTEAASLLIVVTAGALGIIAAKMVDFTVRNTIRASLNIIVAVVAMSVLSAVGLSGLLHLVP